MSPYPQHRTRTVHDLDGIWDFAFLGPDVDLNDLEIGAITFADRMAVPGCFDATPTYAGVRGTAAYRTTVRVSPGTRGVLQVHGLGLWARIYVDGAPVDEVSMPYASVCLDIPPADRAERELILIVDNRFDTDRVPLIEQFFDFYAYGGIYRSIRWHEVPPLSVDRAYITPVDPVAGRIHVHIVVRGTTPSTVNLDIGFDDATVIHVADCPVHGHTMELDLTVPEPRLWSPSDPHMHTLRIELGEDDIVERFGLRTISAEHGRICVNGEPVKLLGYCRHEAHPQYGSALPEQQLIHDLQWLRNLGCNFIRGSHYPQDQRTLDLCDELGILVFEESMGWGQKPTHFTNEAFIAAQLEQTRAMVRKSFNHPSVIIWGFLNEGASQTPESRRLYEGLARTIRDLDGSRLVSYASNHPFDDLNLDLADVVSVNTYPGWYAKDQEHAAPVHEIVPHIHRIMASLADRGFGDKPFLLTEIGAGAIYGWRDPLKAHWSEEYQADCLQTICREVVANPDIAGVALWQFCDCRTYATARALGRPRAFNNKGTLDEYRRPKLAAEAVRSSFTKHQHLEPQNRDTRKTDA